MRRTDDVEDGVHALDESCALGCPRAGRDDHPFGPAARVVYGAKRNQPLQRVPRERERRDAPWTPWPMRTRSVATNMVKAATRPSAVIELKSRMLEQNHMMSVRPVTTREVRPCPDCEGRARERVRTDGPHKGHLLAVADRLNGSGASDSVKTLVDAEQESDAGGERARWRSIRRDRAREQDTPRKDTHHDAPGVQR